MELYKGTINTVEFEAPNVNLGQVQAEYIYNNGPATPVPVPPPTTDNPDIYTIALPYLPNEGKIKVT